MKTYKIKSLAFFLLFAIAGYFYNSIEQEQKFQEKITSSEVVDMQAEDHAEDSDSKDLDTPIK